MYTVNNTNFFDFGVNVGDAKLGMVLDGYSLPISLSTIRFYETTQRILYVSQLIHLHTGTVMGVSYTHTLVVMNNNAVTDFCSS